MKFTTTSLRKLVALFSALLVVVGIGAVVRNVEPTEATWADQVHATSDFSAGQPYARAITTYGTMFPPASRDTNLGPNVAAAGAANSGKAYEQQIDGTDFSGLIGFLPMEAYGRSCARAGGSSAECLLPSPGSPTSTAYAVAETGQMKMWAGAGENVRLVTIGHALNLNSARTTAECRPGATGVAGLNSGGEVILGGDFSDNLTNIYLRGGTRVSMPGVNGTTQDSWNGAAGKYTATISHTSDTGPNRAKSTLRLHVRLTAYVIGTQIWTLDMVLAHAECGAAIQAPSIPSRPAQKGAWPTRAAAARMVSPVLEQELPALTDEDPADSGATIPSLPTTEAPSSETFAPEGTESVPSTEPLASDEPGLTATTTSDAEATAVPTNPDGPEASGPAVPTEPTSVLAGPQDPEPVRVGREFAVVNRDGVELGTARIDDIVQTPGCGVELTLVIRTSAEEGPGRWASIGPGDFAEVRPGGTIRRAGIISPDCEQAANSKTTALSASRQYEIIIPIALDDSAQQAMLRPDGTAGWMFDLPPLPKVTATTSPSASPPTSSPATAPDEPSVETSVNTAAA
ncbi:hypothetical protein [Dietzia maris]|uniref:Uncharacterized protein n=1 Tax=Dietzia maris TaxID=37915 RepID=A0ABT8H546_9ACTN|nr:hypothetical protein [Dietzia maris]MDN4507594.1 hypothetical protein [Dietzia maris]